MATPKWLLPAVAGSGLAGAAIAPMFDSSDPSAEASQYYDQIPDVMKQYYDPYIQQGQESMGTYSDQLQQLLQDPAYVQNLVGQSYKASPGYQYNVDQATQGAQHAAAASGMAGTPAEQEALANQIAGMASQDYNQYVDRGVGQYDQALGGEQYLTGLGYGASSSLADSLAQNLMSQGNMAYSQAQSDQAGTAGLMSGMGQAAMMLPFML